MNAGIFWAFFSAVAPYIIEKTKIDEINIEQDLSAFHNAQLVDGYITNDLLQIDFTYELSN